MAMIKVIGWAHLEIKGYRQHFGFVTEVDIAGLTMLRIEEPDPETGIRKVHTYSPESLFGYHEMTESEVMERLSPAKRLPEYTPVINEDDHEADTEPPTDSNEDDGPEF